MLRTRTSDGRFKKGQSEWIGRKHRPETIEKLRIAKIGKTGPLSNAWKGGRTPRNKHYLSHPQYKAWRTAVFTRDNYICQNCKKHTKDLEGHHIKGWAQYPELRFSVDNGLTLCRECHSLTDNYKAKGRIKHDV